MVIFWERAAHSVYNMFSVFRHFGRGLILVISHFCFEGWTLVLIVSVPGHCLSFSLNTCILRISRWNKLYMHAKAFNCITRDQAV